MKTLYTTLALLPFTLSARAFTLSARAQTADSVRTELTIEPAMATQPADTSERATTEQNKLKMLFRRSRKETAMFKLGIADPNQLPFIIRGELQNRYPLGGFWLCVNHKLSPDFAIRAGTAWSPAGFSSTRQYKAAGDNWLGMLAVDYYPFIRGRIRRGKTANNFYHNPCITLEA